MSSETLPALAAFAISSLIALAALSKGTRGNPAARAFGLLAAGNALWTWGDLLLQWGDLSGYRVILLADLAIPPLLLYFLSAAGGKRTWIVPAILVSLMLGDYRGTLTESTWRIVCLYLALTLLYVILNLLMRKSVVKAEQKRFRLLAMGLAVAGFGGLVNFADSFGIQAPQIGALLNAAGLLFLAATVLRHDVLVLGRSLSVVLADAAIGAILFYLGFCTIILALDREPAGFAFGVSFLLFLTIFSRLRASLRAFVEILFRSELADDARLRDEISARLSSALDETAIGEALCEAVRRLTRAEPGFYLPESKDFLRRVAGTGGGDRVAADALSAPAAAGAWIRCGAGALMVPEKKSGRPLYDRDERLFEDLARFAESALVRIAESRRRESDRAEALTGNLAASVAHDVLNPVRAIAGAAGILAKRGGDPEFTDIIASESARIERLCREFLEYGRPISAELRPARLAGIVRRAVDAARAAGKTEITFTGEAECRADDDAVFRLVANLLGNAAESGARRIHVTILDSPPRIEVEDDGPGIHDDALPRLWTPFQSKKPGGTGLGLPIVKRIAEAHGGGVEVGKSRLGGAAIVVTLAPKESEDIKKP